MEIGGVEFRDGKVIDLTLEPISYIPVFDPVDVGKFTFSLADGVLRFNTGNGLWALNTAISEDPNLKASLGSNWLNPDLSFNPTPFNDLPGIIGLDTNSSLFDVIDQMATNIDIVGNISIEDIDVSEVVAPDMSVIAYLAGNLMFLGIEQVLEGSTISLGFDNLKGFDITSTALGNMIIFDSDGNLSSKKFYYKYENLTTSTSHLINHGLNSYFCSVSCINPNTHVASTPTNITYTSANQIIVTFDTSQPLVALITNFNP